MWYEIHRFLFRNVQVDDWTLPDQIRFCWMLTSDLKRFNGVSECFHAASDGWADRY